MKAVAKKKKFKKIALALSVVALVAWVMLGTGASLAWFTDNSNEINNIFHVAEFDLEVSHRLTDGKWESIDGKTDVFDDEALYEPGYTQVVYLKVENKGDVPFNFYTAVNVNGCNTAINVFGHTFLLQDYLKFGITISDTEEEMKDSIPDRDAAAAIATMPLHNYATDTAMLEAGGTCYIALVVRMPEEVDNVANYREDIVPTLELGITVKADQIRD